MTAAVAVPRFSACVGARLAAILDCTSVRNREQARSYEGKP